MKVFSIIKVGYSSGQAGCTGEYFTAIVINEKGVESFHFAGMYGIEERVAAALKEKGYKEKYVQSFYGRMTRNDYTKNMKPENEILKKIKIEFC